MDLYYPNFYYFGFAFVGFILLIFLFKKEKATPKFLRTCSIFLLLGSIFEPILKFIGKPEVIVLVDTSRSMEVGERLNKIKNQISKIKYQKIYGFDIHPYLLKDSLVAKGELTSIGNALLETPPPSAYILLSDGLNNYGPNPISIAKQRNIPIYTVKIVDSISGDVRISDLTYNNLAYTQDTILINVSIDNLGYNEQKIEILLKENNRILQKRDILLPKENRQNEVKFYVVPKEEGMHLYEVVISPLHGEINKENNYRNFGINVLKSKIRVGWFSNSPSWNFKFAKLELTQDPQIELEWWIKVKDGGWLSKKGITAVPDFNSNYDVLILDNFDYPIEKLKDTGIIIIGKSFIFGQSIRDSQYPIKVEDFNIFERKELPSLKEIHKVKIPEGGVKVLCQTYEGTPVILRSGKVIGIAADDVWRWNFGEEIKFWNKLIKLIAFKGPALFVETSPLINVGERVIFKASAYTQSYAPDEECNIIVTVNDSIKLPLYSLGNGKYEGAIEFLPPGKYTYKAITNKGTEANSEFIIASQLEFERLCADDEFLRTLSSVSGGKYVEDIEEIELPPQKSKVPFNPSHYYFCLVLIILLLSIEWLSLRR